MSTGTRVCHARPPPVLCDAKPPFCPLVGNWVAAGPASANRTSSPPTVTSLPFMVHRSTDGDTAGLDTWGEWYRIYAERVEDGEAGPFDPARDPHADELNAFIRYSRRAARRGLLPPERVRLLDGIGFEWSRALALWRQNLAELVEWERERGTFVVPSAVNASLGQWVRMQRFLKGRGELPADREQMLLNIGFKFDPAQAVLWETRFAELSSFYEMHGHTNVPESKLSQWLRLQRRRHREGRLPQERANRLSTLGVEWQSRDDAWDVMFESLSAFKQEHGHCEVPQHSGYLGRWVHKQRVMNRSGVLTPKRQERLSELGFVWHQQSASWNRSYQALEDFYEIYPEQRGEIPHAPGYRRTAQWLRNQCGLARRGLLRPEREAQLRQAGVKLS